MKKITTILFFVFVACNISNATICITSFEQDSAKADLIFVGKHLNTIKDAIIESGSFEQISLFEIQESFKGLKKTQKYVSILGGYFCCDINFENDSTYLVFAFKYFENPDFFWTNDCSITEKLSSQEAQGYYKQLGYPISHTGEESRHFKYNNPNKTLDSLQNQNDLMLTDIKNLSKQKSNLIIIIMVLIALSSVLITYFMRKTHKKT